MGGPCLVDGTMRPELDNFLQCAFELDGKQWTSAEQYFQAVKFTDEAYREKIRACHDGGACWQLGNSRAFQLRADWESVKVDVMYSANCAKFEQNAALRDALLATRGSITAYGFPFWVKWNAVLLERIREELRPAAERDEAALAERRAAMAAYHDSA